MSKSAQAPTKNGTESMIAAEGVLTRPHEAQPGLNGTPEPDALDLMAADIPDATPVRTAELLDVQDLYVDPDDDELSRIAVRLPKSIPVRRPTKSEWVTVHPDPDYTRVVVLFEHRAKNATAYYFVLGAALQKELRKKYGAVARRIYLAQNNDGHLFLWPAGLPATDGSVNKWVQSEYQRIEAAQTGWIHSAADQHEQTYDIDYDAYGRIPPPEWPAESMDDLVKRAAKPCTIQEGDHPLLRRLREGV
jgi:hypothetical protein